MKLGDPSEISKIQQVIRRILAELERLFHNLHCHFEDNGYAGLQELYSPKLPFSMLCCFLFKLSLPLLPADSRLLRKKEFYFRQATFCPFVLLPTKFPLELLPLLSPELTL